MNGSDLRRQIEIELERLARAVDELHIIQLRLTENSVAVAEKAAAGALLAQFYLGVERIDEVFSAFKEVITDYLRT